MLTMHEPVNFAVVERIRKHTLLSVTDLCAMLGVSRMSYSRWMRGGQPRPDIAELINKKVRELSLAIQEDDFPTPEIAALSRGERLNRLLDLLKKYQ